MSQPLLAFTQIVEQLDKNLRVINQAAHAPSPEAMEEVIREVGPRSQVLVEVWRLLWPAIEKDKAWLQIAQDRITRREPWSAERFSLMLTDIIFADPTLLPIITKLFSSAEQAKDHDIEANDEFTLTAPDEPTETIQEQISTTDTLVMSGIPPWTTGFILAGKFKLLHQLARGGFGEAWLVEDIAGTSPIACVVKKFSFQHPDANILDNIRRRFEQEARALERLGKDHNQIPSLHTFETQGDEGYFVQEYIEGPNLAEYVRDNGPMPEQEVLAFLDSVLEVLSYVHNNKVIHRDIKPANIILRKADRKPVLIDFGALKEVATTVLDQFGHASTTLPIGTPGFMPVEQAQGMPRLSTDIYALGFTALYLLSGKFPIDLMNIATGEVDWSQLDSVLSLELRTILMTAIAQMPDNRFNTARLMHDEISKLIQSREPNAQVEVNRNSEIQDSLEYSDDLSGNTKPANEQKAIHLNPINNIERLQVTKTIDERHASLTLSSWTDESEERLKSLVRENVPLENPSRYSLGSWSVGYIVLEDCNIQSLKELLTLLEKVCGRETGWPPWWIPTKQEVRPYPYGDIVECWIKDNFFNDSAHSDFWRASKQGKMYLLRGYDEDSSSDRYEHRYEPGTSFELTFPIWRIGECLLHAGRFATELSGSASSILFQVKWNGLGGRTLVVKDRRMVSLPTLRPSAQDSVTSKILLTPDRITSSLGEIVQRLTAPLYETFDFYSPPMQLIDDEVLRLKSSRV
jgi:serine/threonine protein kinase